MPARVDNETGGNFNISRTIARISCRTENLPPIQICGKCSVPLGLPKIIWEKETRKRMNFPKGKGNREGNGKGGLILYAQLLRSEKNMSL